MRESLTRKKKKAFNQEVLSVYVSYSNLGNQGHSGKI